jgi:hypothetical protein
MSMSTGQSASMDATNMKTSRPFREPSGKAFCAHVVSLTFAGALALGYANIFVTAPSPENLRTLFEFVFKGLDAAGYQEHIDYDLVESTNPEWGRAVVRVNVFRNHRQVSHSTVQYGFVWWGEDVSATLGPAPTPRRCLIGAVLSRHHCKPQSLLVTTSHLCVSLIADCSVHPAAPCRPAPGSGRAAGD